MFLNIISFLVGFLCLFVMMLMLFNSRLNRKTNIYLIIILFLVGLQRFLNGIELLGLTEVIYSPLKNRLSVAFFIVPVYYLFFNRLIRGTSNLKKELLNFILPIVFVSVDVLIVNYQLNYYIYLIFSSVYFGLILNLVFGLINNKKRSMFEKGSYETIRTWTILMFLITFSLLFFSNYFLFHLAESRINLSDFYRFSSLLWLIALIYIFKNPVIIFGEHTLLKSIQINEPQEFLIWSRKPLKSIEQKDAVLSNNISIKVDAIILSIQKLQKSSQALSKITFTASNLAKELKLPRSHVEFVFKYYCHYSINDFSNLVKINYAFSLINAGYLDKYTIASLGDKCLFNSRFTFSKNFKKFMGISVSDYILVNSRIIKSA
jgi:AraC-like DNA-binding protein